MLRENISAFGERGVRCRELVGAADETSKNELACRPSGERLGDREKVVEASRVGCDDDDCSPSRRRRRFLQSQRGVMAKDRLLELLQGRAWFDAELVDEQLPRLAIDLERLHLAVRAVERLHEYCPQPLAEGCSRTSIRTSPTSSA